jgi:hypothetical protein
MFCCPTDGSERIHTQLAVREDRVTPTATVNYTVCIGSGTGYNYDCSWPTDGIFYGDMGASAGGTGMKTRIASIIDGTTNTILLSETIVGNGEGENTSDVAPSPLQPWSKTVFDTSYGVRGWFSAPGLEGIEKPRCFGVSGSRNNMVWLAGNIVDCRKSMVDNFFSLHGSQS